MATDTQVYVTQLSSGVAIDNTSVVTGVGVVNRQRVTTVSSGSAGTDHSAAQPTFPPAGLTLLATIAANTSRNLIGVQCQDANQMQLWRDDGNGNNLTLILLESGGSTATGGGFYTSTTFFGRVRVYGQAGQQVSAYED